MYCYFPASAAFYANSKLSEYDATVLVRSKKRPPEKVVPLFTGEGREEVVTPTGEGREEVVPPPTGGVPIPEEKPAEVQNPPKTTPGDQERIDRKVRIILSLCLANGNSVRTTTGESGVRIDSREVSGIVEGISSQLTDLSSQQASETRACTQRFISRLLDESN
jgi:hypothetical protein